MGFKGLIETSQNKNVLNFRLIVRLSGDLSDPTFAKHMPSS